MRDKSMAFNLFWSRGKSSSGGVAEEPAPFSGITPTAEDFHPAPQERAESDPLRAMFQQQRFNGILKEADKWKDHPDWSKVSERAAESLDNQMAIVPEG